MIISKAQGLPLNGSVIGLREECSDTTRTVNIYVACSEVGSPGDLHVLAAKIKKQQYNL
jgi:hypothetical protein